MALELAQVESPPRSRRERSSPGRRACGRRSSARAGGAAGVGTCPRLSRGRRRPRGTHPRLRVGAAPSAGSSCQGRVRPARRRSLHAVEVGVLGVHRRIVRLRGRGDPGVLHAQATAARRLAPRSPRRLRRRVRRSGSLRTSWSARAGSSGACSQAASDAAIWMPSSSSASVTTETAASAGSSSVASGRPCSSAMNTDVSRMPLTARRSCPAVPPPARGRVRRQPGPGRRSPAAAAPRSFARGGAQARQRAPVDGDMQGLAGSTRRRTSAVWFRSCRTEI